MSSFGNLSYYAIGILILALAIFLMYIPNVIRFIKKSFEKKRNRKGQTS